MSDPIDLTGLDYDYLRYTGVNAADQRKNHSFYLPFFRDCRRVVDLGCGDGDFVQLLVEQGVEALGVDSDPIAAEKMRARGLSIIAEDALTYLQNVEAGSLDGIFSAHLVEHLRYQAVYQLIFYANRALKSGGRIVLATPNPHALISHLDLYWLHFGHVSFYHPRLLCFFLHRVGFRSETWGENPAPPHPLLGSLYHHQAPPQANSIDPGRFERRSIDWEASPPREKLSRWRRSLRGRLARLLGLDDIVRQVNQEFAQLPADMDSLIDRVDRPFECFATAVKP